MIKGNEIRMVKNFGSFVKSWVKFKITILYR